MSEAKKRKRQKKTVVIAPLNEVRETRERKCLRCAEPFQSWGAGNRLCEPCRDYARHLRSGLG